MLQAAHAVNEPAHEWPKPCATSLGHKISYMYSIEGMDSDGGGVLMLPDYSSRIGNELLLFC